MLQAILKDTTNFPRGNPQVENLITAVENRVRYTPRTEENHDWSIWKNLFRVLAGERFHLVYNPRYTTYNSLIYAIGDGFGNPKSKWFGCHVLTGDFDNNPNTVIDVVVLDSKNRLMIVNWWIAQLKMGQILRDRTAMSMFPDPNVYNAFKGTEGWRKMGGFLKLFQAERNEYDGDLDRWGEVYREDHPGAFLSSLQQTIRKWITSFSNQYNLQAQSGLEKKQWNAVINHAATAVSECMKQKYYRTSEITRNHYIFAINETFKIYHNGSFTSLVPNGVAYSSITRMIMMLKKKKEDADAKKTG
jgi:hypothetical protein